jgi:hypothetical protein
MSFRYCESLWVCERFANAMELKIDDAEDAEDAEDAARRDVFAAMRNDDSGSDDSGSDEFTPQCCKTNGDFFVVFADKCLCARKAFAAACADIELCANLRQRSRASIYGSADGSVGNIVADANNHGGLVICKCEQFLFRLLTKPCSIARGFLNSCRGRQKEEIAPEAGAIGLGR